MRNRRPLALALLVLLSGCGKTEKADEAAKNEAASDDRLVLSEDQVKSLGITTVAVKAAEFRSGVSGYGVVVSLDTIGQTDSDFLTAQAVAAQSQAAAARAQYLFSAEGGAVSRESMEAAQSTTRPADKRGLMAMSRLVLAIILFILVAGMMLTFRFGRLFFPRPSAPSRIT